MYKSITFVIVATSSTLALAGPTVYRCEEAGKMLFSDAPCVGGQIIDATPNRRGAPDVLRRRVQLTMGDGETCKQMDESMSRLHEAVQQPEPNSRAQAEFQLDIARKKYLDHKC